MRVSLNTIKRLNQQYKTADDVTKIGVDELVKKVGAQLGAVEEVIKFGDKYQGIIIAKVVSCQPHPDADKLKVCLIDDGGVVKDVKRDDQGLVQVVCGAPNVHEGMLAAWLPPGATVPDTIGNEPFVLEARELRGVVSNGMLASPKELSLGESHDGLLEIDGDIKPGSDFAETYGLKDDSVLDIENKMFTHRPDCFGLLGVARELAGIQSMPFKSPDWYTPKPQLPQPETDELKLTVTNELPELVPRFTAVTMRDVEVGPSPVWLQVELAKVGQKSINNIVDYTNYFMVLTGQPLHAFDYDKLKSLSNSEAAIVIRNPKPGEKLTLLNRQEIEPRAEAIMIATDKQLIGVAGIKGGADTEVDLGTKNIILECANFDMYSIRRTSMAHGLFSDAATRFTKGQSPLQPPAVLTKIIEEIRAQAGGKVASQVIDSNSLDKTVLERQSLFPTIKLDTNFVNQRLGSELTSNDIQALLSNVEFKVDVEGDNFNVTAPFWRTDVELREDVVEEVGRLHGYDQLPLELPKRDLTPTPQDPLLTGKSIIRRKLSTAGANEVLTYSFVHGSLLNSVGQDPAKAYQIANALSPDLEYYRLSLMPSLLDKVHPNIKAGYDMFALFELGAVHTLESKPDKDGLPQEHQYTGLVLAVADKLKPAGSAYYQAKKYLENLVNQELVYQPVDESIKGYAAVQPYEPNRSAQVSLKSGEFLGIIGEFKPSVARALKLPKYCAGFEVDTEVVQQLLATGPAYQPLSRFPSVKQDITLKAPAKLNYQTVGDFVAQEAQAHAPKNSRLQVEALDIYQKQGDHINFTFRLTTTAFDRTLTDAEVNQLLDAVAAAAKTKLSAERI